MCTKLREHADRDGSGAVLAGELAVTLDTVRNKWVKSFYHLRNLVIHRNGLMLAGVWNRQIGDARIFVHVSSLLQASRDRDVVERIVTQLGLFEGELSSSSVIEPVNMCEKLWARLAELVNSVLEQSRPQIDHFVSEQ